MLLPQSFASEALHRDDLGHELERGRRRLILGLLDRRRRRAPVALLGVAVPVYVG